jgi:CheY-like chemotaxis protein
MAKKILLADDSITIQKVVELTFSDGDYEVTAVNNGAKAIQKLSEMRPDIILSDIIMPEKNGYEVCEYVKSHPEYRNIPVILLTGTFEPFDPDRADKAGCDAVVTKPFESQSLIHKVEELVQQSKANASAAEPERAPAPALFDDEAPSFEPPVATAPDPFAHDNDIFSAAPAATPTLATDMPFDNPPGPAFGGETRAIPRMSFEEMQQVASEPAPPTAPQAQMPVAETSPWDEPPAFGGETRAFPRMSFEEMQQMASGSQPASEPHSETPGPFDAAPASPQTTETSPWDEPQADAGATRALPKMSFEEMRQMAEQSKPAPAQFDAPAETPAAEASPWDEQPAAFGGETRAFPSMSFEEMEKMAANPAAASEPAWASAEEMPTADPFAESGRGESPFAAETPASAPPSAEEQMWSSPEPARSEASAPDFVNPQITDAAGPAGDLTDSQVDRIARRVVQLMSEEIVRNIAWEVIPDLAEMVVKERIRQLEAEA